MATVHEIGASDLVELTEPVDGAPAGARGGVDKVFGDGRAMVELTSLPAEMGLDRILVIPLSKLRVIEPARHS